MKRMLENLTGNYTASASVVDGTLILSLPDALSPVVWRLELSNAKASALEVREGDGGVFRLMLKTPRGDVNDIAGFASRGRAVAALMAVSRAMEQSHGQIYPAANDTEPYNPAHLPVAPKRGKVAGAKKGGLVGVVVAIAVIVGLGMLLINMTPPKYNAISGASAPAQSATPSGVPVSADDFLKNR
ncbi:MAG: hypothetical protein JWO78_1301 [Micavibrio sp.]|nr:hypothetical protein [Micavibrio sp.]